MGPVFASEISVRGRKLPWRGFVGAVYMPLLRTVNAVAASAWIALILVELGFPHVEIREPEETYALHSRPLIFLSLILSVIGGTALPGITKES